MRLRIKKKYVVYESLCCVIQLNILDLRILTCHICSISFFKKFKSIKIGITILIFFSMIKYYLINYI